MVSIITPIYNRLDLVPETWASIQEQTNPDWEWIVVDDGSTDGSIDYIGRLSQQDKRVKLILRGGKINGPSRCRNIGVAQSKGDYLLFLDSDDIIGKTCLEKRVEFIKKHKQIDFAVFTQATFEHTISEQQPIFNKFYSEDNDYLKAFIADEHPWQTSGPLWRKESFLTTKGFREDYKIMEDPELHIRALLMGMEFKTVRDKPDFFYRQSQKTEVQFQHFWKQSIKGRIIFYKNLEQLLKVKGCFTAYKNSLQLGLKTLFKVFILSRLKYFSEEFHEVYQWAKQKNLLSWKTRILLLAYTTIQKHFLLSKIPFLKGGIYKAI